jgi:hypothetical protein
MKFGWLFAGLILLLFTANIALSDVTLKSTVENTGLGGVMNMQGTQMVLISGNKEKTVTSMKMTNKVVKFLGGGKPQETAEIMRLDKDVVWTLNAKEKEYSELTFAQMKALAEQAVQKGRNEKARKQEDSIRITADVTVTPTGQSQTIIGYKSDEVLVKMTFTGTDTSTGKTSRMVLDMDLWLAKDVPGYAEYRSFHQKLGEKLGVTAMQGTGMTDALKGFGVDLKIVYEKMKDFDGMSMKTVVSILPEGFDTLAVQTQDTVQSPGVANQEEPKQKEEKGSPLKKIGGLFGKKTTKEKDTDKGALAGKGSKSPEKPYLFHMTTTVAEISDASIANPEFEIPDGYKLKK